MSQAPAPVQAVEPWASSEGPDAAPPDASSTDPDVTSAIHREVSVRIGELKAHFDAQGAESDIIGLLDALAHPGAGIRQPPLAAQAVLALSRRPDYGLHDMTRLVEGDPAMSQALLRHANSAWYAGSSRQPLLSISGAIHRVGSKGIHATVMHQMIQGGLSRPGAGLDHHARMVWEHMVRTAPIARSIGSLFGADPEEAFTLGLLHDVGKLVFFDGVGEERKRLRRELRLPAGFVTAALNVLHEPLGGLAALSWGLDTRSAWVIATHHRLGDHPRTEPLSEVVFVAEAVDIARQKDEDLDMAGLWQAGALRGPRESLEAWLANEAELPDEERWSGARRRPLRA